MDPRPSTLDEKVTTADVLEALHQATGMPIVADFYTRLYAPREVAVQDEPLFDALNRIADAMRMRWTKDDAWLQFRTTSFYDDRLKEVPNRLLSRWAASRREHGALTLDDLIEIAGLPETQLDGGDMAEGAKYSWGLAEWSLARDKGLRPQFRFLAGLTPAQRQEAASGNGLAFSRLTLPQQQQFIALSGNVSDRVRSLEELANTALHVEYTVPGWWLWYSPEALPPGWPPLGAARVRERTREAAMQAARRMDPQADETQLRAAKLDVAFIYVRRAPDGIHVSRRDPNGSWGRNLTQR